MTRLAAVIPTYSIRQSLIDMEVVNAKAWKSHVDDLIICEDGPPVAELKKIANLYIVQKVNVGTCFNANMGWANALKRGADYVVLMDSDVSPVSGSLRDLCVPGKVTVPVIIEFPDTAYNAPMMCVPKEIADDIGLYPCSYHRDEGFDPEYAYKIYDHGYDIEQVKSVRVSHLGPTGEVGGATRFNRV